MSAKLWVRGWEGGESVCLKSLVGCQGADLEQDRDVLRGRGDIQS